ncbi:hypothetical protein HYPBUDRAFT_230380 [Hyphopichia burtonii NRRL Y-1933]|uniref:Uncharacterized protein n=1 Tax=Hyphopichia burtonii NRRL Y-1933 TaxID=984485 RepID=A0A1E4RD38_9ASCO|nr:hypothetical protein HYPBUDRAFT_230380 [Hyphopichia burtonii NRRL Y-1933]ODV65143.1 hypothetical protein HYPBUDRAFT_230380 [Hyphopichia burtonii NRRL Y-1933]
MIPKKSPFTRRSDGKTWCTGPRLGRPPQFSWTLANQRARITNHRLPPLDRDNCVKLYRFHQSRVIGQRCF